MTRYNTAGVSRISYVDGGLSTDEDTRDEQFEMIVTCLMNGAARCLLDTARDDEDEDADVAAVQWHADIDGWETSALTVDSKALLEKTVRAFAGANLANIIWLAERIAWDERYQHDTFSRDSGMGMYRVGMLLAYELGGHGIGFDDYGPSRDEFSSKVVQEGRTYWGLDGQLSLWVTNHPEPAFEDNYIISDEEPCLLHLGVGR